MIPSSFDFLGQSEQTNHSLRSQVHDVGRGTGTFLVKTYTYSELTNSVQLGAGPLRRIDMWRAVQLSQHAASLEVRAMVKCRQ
jgi:hypothetical protein